MTAARPWPLAAALALGLTLAQAPARAEMASGTVLANSCFSCHGPDGKSVGDMPTIAGKSASTIVEKLASFKTGETESTIMGRIAKGFTEAEIEALARFFSGR